MSGDLSMRSRGLAQLSRKNLRSLIAELVSFVNINIREAFEWKIRNWFRLIRYAALKVAHMLRSALKWLAGDKWDLARKALAAIDKKFQGTDFLDARRRRDLNFTGTHSSSMFYNFYIRLGATRARPAEPLSRISQFEHNSLKLKCSRGIARRPWAEFTAIGCGRWKQKRLLPGRSSAALLVFWCEKTPKHCFAAPTVPR